MLEVTAAQMKELERKASEAGLSYEDMMENAGQAAARILLERLPGLRTAAVVCGRGNNGGDGFVAARKLFEAGCCAHICLADGVPGTPGAARTNYLRAQRLGVPICALEQADEAEKAFLRTAQAVVDAVTGTGFHGQLRENARLAAQLINGAQGFVLALDVPSAIEADTGRAAEGAVKAALTVTFHAKKPCHRLAKGHCGEVRVARIGI